MSHNYTFCSSPKITVVQSQENRKKLFGTILRLRERRLITFWRDFCLLNQESCSHLSFQFDTSVNHVKEILQSLQIKLWQFSQRSLLFKNPLSAGQTMLQSRMLYATKSDAIKSDLFSHCFLCYMLQFFL